MNKDFNFSVLVFYFYFTVLFEDISFLLLQACSYYSIFLLELVFQNIPVGTSIFMVNATDPDQGTGGSVLFSFQPPSSFFAIDGPRGTVTVTKGLDYETTTAYQLTVNATVSTHRLLYVLLQTPARL